MRDETLKLVIGVGLLMAGVAVVLIQWFTCGGGDVCAW